MKRILNLVHTPVSQKPFIKYIQLLAEKNYNIPGNKVSLKLVHLLFFCKSLWEFNYFSYSLYTAQDKKVEYHLQLVQLYGGITGKRGFWVLYGNFP